MGSFQVEVALLGAGILPSEGEIDGFDGDVDSLHAEISAAIAMMKRDFIYIRAILGRMVFGLAIMKRTSATSIAKKTGIAGCLSFPGNQVVVILMGSSGTEP
jgi:hypothetical protein